MPPVVNESDPTNSVPTLGPTTPRGAWINYRPRVIRQGEGPPRKFRRGPQVPSGCGGTSGLSWNGDRSRSVVNGAGRTLFSGTAISMTGGRTLNAGVGLGARRTSGGSCIYAFTIPQFHNKLRPCTPMALGGTHSRRMRYVRLSRKRACLYLAL
jgi:hypothetical protein